QAVAGAVLFAVPQLLGQIIGIEGAEHAGRGAMIAIAVEGDRGPKDAAARPLAAGAEGERTAGGVTGGSGKGGLGNRRRIEGLAIEAKGTEVIIVRPDIEPGTFLPVAVPIDGTFLDRAVRRHQRVDRKLLHGAGVAGGEMAEVARIEEIEDAALAARH